MTVLEEGVRAELVAYGGLTALIGTRVYHLFIPQGATLPCVTYQRISTPRELTHQSVGATGDLAHPRFQFDAWATTAASSKAIIDQVRAALHGQTGAIGTGANIVTIRAALVDGEESGYNPETRLHRSRSDFIIWQEE